jgi:hypothetical protein
MSDLETSAVTATTRSPPGTGSVTDTRLLAAQLFNETWRLLEQDQRTRADDDRMIHTAHASRCHWGQVPAVTPTHLARGEWLISRVYAEVAPRGGADVAQARCLPGRNLSLLLTR